MKNKPNDAKRPYKRKSLPRVYFNTGKHIIEVEHSRESYNKGKIDEQFVAAVEAASSEFFRVGWPEDGPIPRAAKEYFELRPASEYHEDEGTVLWWHLPICEPPYVGGIEVYRDQGQRFDGSLPADWLTHWSPIPQPSLATPSTPEAQT